MPQWYEREAALARCPILACRRSQTCRHNRDGDACRRSFMKQPEAYTTLARKLERLQREMIARRPPGLVVERAEPGSPLFEQRNKELYEALRERDEASAANQIARQARLRAERQAKREQPARPPSGA